MARELPQFAPTTLEQYEELIEIALEIEQERYDTEVAEAIKNAEKQWDAEVTKKRERIIAQLEANLAIETVNTPDGTVSLPEAEYKRKRQEGIKAINEQLNKEYEEVIQQAKNMVQQPKSRKEIETTYDMYKTDIERSLQQQAMPKLASEIPAYNAIWTDGEQYWDVAGRCYLNPNARASIDQSRVVILGTNGVSSFEENIRQNIKLYGTSDSRIQLGPEIMTTEELFTALRTERDKRIAATDYLLTPDYPVSEAKLAAVTVYRAALRDLPAQPGAPWDGGGKKTPWPVME